MKLEYFIAKRIIKAKTYKSSVSGPIIKIGITAIALGITMMLVAVATGTGLQIKVREKLAAFNGHILISNFDNNVSEVSLNPISKNCDFYPNFTSVKEVVHIQAVAKKRESFVQKKPLRESILKELILFTIGIILNRF